MSRNARFITAITTILCWFCCPLPLAVFAQTSSNGFVLSDAGARARARVVIVQDDLATRAFKPDGPRVRRLVDRALVQFTGQSNVASAWHSLVATQEIVGLKVLTAAGPGIGTRLPVVEAIVQGLIAARIPPPHIIIWDRHLADLRRAGFAALTERYGVRVAGAADAGWDEKVFYESALLGQLVHGDQYFNRKPEKAARNSHVSKLVSQEMTKIINVTPLLNHNTAGVSGNLVSLTLGSVDNILRFEGDPARLAQAVPEIYALPALGDRVVLNIVDALICQYEGEQVGRLHYSTALNQIRVSTDPVALDILSIQELTQQREAKGVYAHASTNALPLYRNAALLELGVTEPQQIQIDGDKSSSR